MEFTHQAWQTPYTILYTNIDIYKARTSLFNATHLCIPVGWWVSDEEREYIAESLIKLVREHG